MATTTARQDERLAETGLLKRLLSRPELGAVGGAILVFIFFALFVPEGRFLTLRSTANYLEVAAQTGILAVAVALLMIGGEFDLSIGSMIGFAGLAMAIVSTELGLPLPIAAIVSLIFCWGFGFMNGYLVMWTKLPSFIITLANLFMIRGLSLGITRLITGVTVVGGLDETAGYGIMKAIFDFGIPVGEAVFAGSIFWWILVTAVATFFLLRTRSGNWTFGMGGAENAARNTGVPVDRLKIALFMTTASAAWLVACIQISVAKSADVKRGFQLEFVAIIAAVIGGNLLTGGYGSAIGAFFGALIYGIARQGIILAGVDNDWFEVFLGALLIIAVLVNNYIRESAEKARS